MSSILNDSAPQIETSPLRTVPNTINYDEQIRAPRMSTASASYVYDVGVPRPFKPSQRFLDSSSFSNSPKHSHHETSSPETAAQETPKSTPYHPATVDLNAPTRRNLTPQKLSYSDIPQSFLTEAQRSFLGQAPRTSSPSLSPVLSASDGSSESSRSTLKSLKSGLISVLEDSRAPLDTAGCSSHNYHRNRKNGHLLDTKGPGLQQLYESKRPLCTPAVLRPQYDRNTSYVDSMDLDQTSPLHDSCHYPIQIDCLDHDDTLGPVEPPHDHWALDSSTDHCTKCFAVFGSFLSRQSKRRHHCRFCGMLFCLSCLFKNTEFAFLVPSPAASATTSNEGSNSTRSPSHSSTNSGHLRISSVISGNVNEDLLSGAMMDSKCRLVVPIFNHLNQYSSQASLMIQKFKVCKICKDCGANYMRLVHTLNLSFQDDTFEIDSKSLFVFIENPFLQGHLRSQMETNKGEAALGAGNDTALLERQGSSANGPDWTWSSF